MIPWWDILKVNKDADLRTIKRAYAAKLKTIRQDENPAEFMALREAYENAKLFIQNNLDLREAAHGKEIIRSNREGAQYDDDAQHEEDAQYEIVIGLLSEADSIMRDKLKRREITTWKVLFKKLSELNFNQHAEFEINFITLLSKRSGQIFAKEKFYLGVFPKKPVIGLEPARFIFSYFSWHTPEFLQRYEPKVSDLYFRLSGKTLLKDKGFAEAQQYSKFLKLKYAKPVNYKHILFYVLAILFFLSPILNRPPNKPDIDKPILTQKTKSIIVRNQECIAVLKASKPQLLTSNHRGLHPKRMTSKVDNREFRVGMLSAPLDTQNQSLEFDFLTDNLEQLVATTNRADLISMAIECELKNK